MTTPHLKVQASTLSECSVLAYAEAASLHHALALLDLAAVET